MASLFRRAVKTWKLNGKCRTLSGERVTKDTPGAVCESHPAPVFSGRYKSASGQFITVSLCANKTAAKQMLAKLVTDARMASVNLADTFEEHRKRPLTEHLADYRGHLLAEGDCAEHVDKTCARIRAIFDGCKCAIIPDLDAEAVSAHLHERRRDLPRQAIPPGQEWFSRTELLAALGEARPAHLARVLKREGLQATGQGKARRYRRETVEALQERFCRGIGVATSNGYLTAIRGFTRWLATGRPPRWPHDPLAGLSSLNARTDVRHERRPLNEGELRSVLAAAGASTVIVEELTGRDRMMLYLAAATTGFRASELASLGLRSFDLAGHPPTVKVRAGYTKNKREAVQPLPPDVAEALRGFLAEKQADQPIWPGAWPARAAEMLRQDLTAAGIAYRDEDGRVADFHALRHSFVTLLSQSGVGPKVAQELARHSDIRLTMNVYTHAGLFDLAGAVGGLPRLLDKSGEKGALKATGTEGKPPRLYTRLHQTDDDSHGQERTREDAEEKSDSPGGFPQVVKMTEFEDGCRRERTPDKETTRPGFEPGQREPKSLVLPLHYRVRMRRCRHIQLSFKRLNSPIVRCIGQDWSIVGSVQRP